jgi:hypothetical protein
MTTKTSPFEHETTIRIQPSTDQIVIGSCSECGGAVCVPRVFMSTVRPVAYCNDCGARDARGNGPTIPMRKP